MLLTGGGSMITRRGIIPLFSEFFPRLAYHLRFFLSFNEIKNPVWLLEDWVRSNQKDYPPGNGLGASPNRSGQVITSIERSLSSLDMDEEADDHWRNGLYKSSHAAWRPIGLCVVPRLHGSSDATSGVKLSSGLKRTRHIPCRLSEIHFRSEIQ